jgi:hypothetical protein
LTGSGPVYRKSETRPEKAVRTRFLVSQGMVAFLRKILKQSVTLLNLEIALQTVIFDVAGTTGIYFFL